VSRRPLGRLQRRTALPLIDDLVGEADELTDWRRRLHAHPETAFTEHRTAAFVAEKLTAWGWQVTTGLAVTGVVGTLRAGVEAGDGPTIGLRADLDALPISEASDRPHRSTVPGKMHACGHDGHTVMLLAAARHLARSRRFRGTVRVIFQPAEENEAGGRLMVEEGLFDRFPVDAVYGLHNWPALPAGLIACRAGPIMAACDLLEIEISGQGGHGAMPHLGTDPIVAQAALIQALQTVVSRTVDPADPAVVSITQVHGGDTWNVIPARVLLRGTTRSFRPTVQERLEAAIRRLAAGVAAAHGCAVRLDYRRQYPATINTPDESRRAASAAAQVVGQDQLVVDAPPSMGAEDFAFMLQARPGCYVWLGSGGDPATPGLHHPRYDFNDRVLPVGASYWVRLVEQELPSI
jgi:hippurate hydrolase